MKRCFYCLKEVQDNDNTAYEEVMQWVKRPKKDGAVLRTYTGQAAHAECIDKEMRGIARDQQELL